MYRTLDRTRQKDILLVTKAVKRTRKRVIFDLILQLFSIELVNEISITSTVLVNLIYAQHVHRLISHTHKTDKIKQLE